MSLTKDTIQHLESAKTTEALIDALKKSNAHQSAIIVPDNYQLRDVEKFLPNAKRIVGSFMASDVDSFASYVTEYAEEALCAVSSNLCASCVLDFGDVDNPLHCDHKVSLQLKRTPAYLALIRMTESRCDQKSLADFIEDWSDFMVVLNSSGEVMQPGTAVQKVRNVTIDQARNVSSSIENLSSQLSASEKIELRNQSSFPAEISFKCCPYVGLDERYLTVKISINTGSERPEFVLRIVRHDDLIDQFCDEFTAKIIESLNGCEAVKVFKGKI